MGSPAAAEEGGEEVGGGRFNTSFVALVALEGINFTTRSSYLICGYRLLYQQNVIQSFNSSVIKSSKNVSSDLDWGITTSTGGQ